MRRRTSAAAGLVTAGAVLGLVMATAMPAVAGAAGADDTAGRGGARAADAATRGDVAAEKTGSQRERPGVKALGAMRSSAAPALVAGAPTSLTVTPGPQQLLLSWRAVDGLGQVSYDVALRRPAVSSEWGTVATGLLATSHSLSGLVDGAAYEVQVAARDDDGLGPWSATAGGTPVSVPAAPQIVRLDSAAPGEFTVGWSIDSDGGSPVTSWTVRHSVDGDPVVTTTVSDPGARQATVTGVAGGVVEVSVSATNAVGDSPASSTVMVIVAAPSHSLAVSTTKVLPYVDGYLDAVLVSASSLPETSGEIVVVSAAGRRVAARALGIASSWQWRWNGRASTGVRVPFGRYAVVLRLLRGGRLIEVERRAVTVALSQVGAPSIGLTTSTLYPVRDGYRDSMAITVRTGLPATGELRAVSGTRVLARWPLSRGTAWRKAWGGRTSTGALAPARVSFVAVVRGGEGAARSAARAVSVSGKKLVAKKYERIYTATALVRSVLAGSFSTGLNAGSVGLWSSPYSSDVLGFSVALPAGVRYGPTTVMGCALDSWYDGRRAALLYFTAGGELSNRGAVLGDTAACWYGDAAPASFVVGRTLRWAVGNVDEDYSWYYVDGFKIRGTVYVLA